METGNDDVAQEELLTLAQVLRRTATKRSTLYGWIRKGLFPPPIRIGPRRVAWRKRDVDEWILQAIARGRKFPPGTGMSSAQCRAPD